MSDVRLPRLHRRGMLHRGVSGQSLWLIEGTGVTVCRHQRTGRWGFKSSGGLRDGLTARWLSEQQLPGPYGDGPAENWFRTRTEALRAFAAAAALTPPPAEPRVTLRPAGSGSYRTADGRFMLGRASRTAAGR